LLGNKSDLEHREVTAEEGRELAQTLNTSYFEVSAKTGENVEAAMLSLLDSVLKLINQGKYNGQAGVGALVFAPEDEDNQKSKPCC
jgi:GTPase SAR1 family protein